MHKLVSKKNLIWTILAIAAIVLVACGASATATPPPTATPVPTPVPTVAPTEKSAPPVSTASTATRTVAAIEVEPADLARYIDALTPPFAEALQDRLSLNDEFAAPGPQSEVVDALAWFREATAIQLQLADSFSDVEPPTGMESLHLGVLEAVLGWADLGDRIIELLSNAGPDFNIGTDLAFHPEMGVEVGNRIYLRAGKACRDIENVAADNGIPVEFRCGTPFR